MLFVRVRFDEYASVDGVHVLFVAVWAAAQHGFQGHVTEVFCRRKLGNLSGYNNRVTDFQWAIESIVH